MTSLEAISLEPSSFIDWFHSGQNYTCVAYNNTMGENRLSRLASEISFKAPKV